MTIRRLILAASMMLALATAPVASAAPATGGSSATILGALRIEKTSDLNFGQLAVPGQPGVVRIRADNSRVCSNGLVCMGSASAAAFTLNGRPNERVEISLDKSTVNLTNAAGNRISASLSQSHSHIRLNGGEAVFQIFGTLQVRANQAPGAYRGSFSVLVQYD
ncbi:DUF4402 domain-containing protein [Sphingobium xenophagum]|uniref:DUF4402 domain-containing protein n=1 Tax=Sphingobium xenophagum TaxID=121428 RepID=UPI00036CFF83|nr:DUF4402 domain-containing protein [Sphingobium xenophagum]